MKVAEKNAEGHGMIDYLKKGEIYLINLPLKPGDNKNRPALFIFYNARTDLAGISFYPNQIIVAFS